MKKNLKEIIGLLIFFPQLSGIPFLVFIVLVILIGAPLSALNIGIDVVKQIAIYGFWATLGFSAMFYILALIDSCIGYKISNKLIG